MLVIPIEGLVSVFVAVEPAEIPNPKKISLGDEAADNPPPPPPPPPPPELPPPPDGAGAGAGGELTVTSDVPVTVTAPVVAVAVIVAVPADTLVTMPVALSTVAMAALPLDQFKLAPTNGALFWSTTEVVSCCVWPVVKDAAAGVTVTLVSTGTGITLIADVFVSVVWPLTAVAVIVAVPTATAVTRPFVFTVATFVSFEAYEIAAPANALPPWSNGEDVIC